MSAAAVRVSPEWLALREPADAAARSRRARRAPRAAPPGGRPPRDPRPRRRHRLDGPLARAAAARPAALGGARPRRGPAGARAPPPAPPTGRGHRRDAAVRHHPAGAGRSRRRDPRHRLGAARHADRGRAGRGCSAPARGACPMLLALTVVGRVALTPGRSAGRAHRRGVQRPPAPRRRPCSARTPSPPPSRRSRGRRRGRSSGRAPGASARPHADLTAEWFDGWVAAACEQEPALAAEAGAYRDRRLAQAAAGELAVTVDHADLLVLP